MRQALAAFAVLIVGLVAGVGLTHAAPTLRGTKIRTVVRTVTTPVPSPFPVVHRVVKRVRVPVYVTLSPAADNSRFATLCYTAINHDLGVYPSDAQMSECEATVAQGGAPP